MPYQNNIPLAPDQLSRSQGDINGNFQILGAIGGIPGVNNSAGINTAPGAGFNYLFLNAGGANPPAGSVFANSNALFSSPIAAVNELFVNKNNQAGAVQIPFTKSILSTAVAPANGLPGWTYLPSGIIIKWGIIAVPNIAAGGTANFDATVPFTRFFAATLGNGNSGGANYSSQISALSTVSITVVNRGTALGTYVAANVYYCVIGY
jgi:hypothetical protein